MYTDALWTPFAPVVPEADAPDVDGRGLAEADAPDVDGRGLAQGELGLLLPLPTAPSGLNTSC